jgi:hypothetical protein
MTMRAFLLGAGYSAGHFARLIGAEAEVIHGTTRSGEKAERLQARGIAPLVFDGSGIELEMAAALREATHLVTSAAPAGFRPSPPAGPSPRKDGEREDGRNADAPLSLREERKGEGQFFADPLLSLLPRPITDAMPALRWIGYLSTVGVYGDHRGAVVTEESELRPKSRRAVERVKAEQDWLAAGAGAGIPVAVLRLAGIYGPGRNALVNLERGTARRVVKPGQVFNRIHVADIAGALHHLATHEVGGIFNVCDDEPGPPQDVVTFAAELMGVEPPPEIQFEEAEMTPMARSFWGDNKRVSNARLKATGYRFRFPDHRVALEAMWRDGSWREGNTDETAVAG